MNYLIQTITALILLVSLNVNAQTDNKTGAWNAFFVDYNLNEKSFVRAEFHSRRAEFYKNWSQILLRPSYHYKVNETLSLSGGYTYIKNFSDIKNFNENNIWQQLTLTHSSKQSSFLHWFRFEQRFIQQFTPIGLNQFIKENDRFLTRFRYRFNWTHPLFKFKNDMPLNISIFNEIWLNTGSGILPKSLNQNWFEIGFNYEILKNLMANIGYLNVYVPQGNDAFISNHILNTLLIYKLN